MVNMINILSGWFSNTLNQARLIIYYTVVSSLLVIYDVRSLS